MTGSAIRTPDQRLRVFVSSTLGELAEERRAVRDAVEQLRLSPVMFELGARPHPPRALYRSYLEQSDVFLGIYWQSYGWVAPDMEVSGLEDELVLSAGLPRLVYVKRPAPEMAPRLDQMLGRLRDEDSTSYKPFKDAGELQRLVLDDLSLMLTEQFTASRGSRRRPDGPPAPSAPTVPTTSFVGRDEMLASLCDEIAHGKRLLTLVGPGGTGKTRLALEAAAKATDDFPGGVVVVDLSDEHDPTRVLGAVVRAVAPVVPPVVASDAPPLDTLERGLGHARVLIVLDNFEQVTAAAPDVAALVRRCPRTTVLVTSRESMRVRDETVVRVPPLEEPAAVRLFLDRAADVRPDVAPGAEMVDDVVAVCRRLDALPLAIELAAARLRLFSLAELRERLDHGLDELRGGPRDLPERQQALRRTIEWSVGLLDDDERTVLAALSVFSGARLADVEAVIGSLPGLEHLDVVETTASLLDKSLIQPATLSTGAPRFVMLETIKAYAEELLAESPERAESARRAHAEHYTRLAGEWRGRFGPEQRAEALTALGDEHGNLRAAWACWVDTGDVTRMNDLLELLWGYYDARGAYGEAVGLGEDLLRVLALQPATAERVRDEIAMQTSMARSLIAVQGYDAEVERRIQAALVRAGDAGDTSPRFPVLRALGTLHLLRAEFPRSREVSDELLEIAAGLQDPGLLADAHQLAGITEMNRDVQRSLEHFDASIDYFEQSPPARVQFRVGPEPGVVSHVISGLLLWTVGLPDSADRRVERALDLAREAENPYTRAYVLFHASLLSLWRQDVSVLGHRAQELQRVATAHGYPIWSALGELLDGVATIAAGSPDLGLSAVEHGFELYGNLDTPPVFWAHLLAIRASACLMAGRHDEAERYVEEGTTALWEGDPTAAELEILRADIRLAREDRDGASASLRRAADVAVTGGLRMTHLHALLRLATLLRDTEEGPAALAELARAYGDLTEGHDTPLLRQVAAVVASP